MSIKVSLLIDSNELVSNNNNWNKEEIIPKELAIAPYNGDWNIDEIAKELAITPYEIKEYPLNAALRPSWYTQVITDSRCIDEPLKIIRARTMYKIDNLLAVCEKYKITPTVQIMVFSDYPHRPELTLKPSDIEFINLIHAELRLDVMID